MVITNILYGIVFFFIVLAFILTIIGILYKPQTLEILLDPEDQIGKQQCLTTQTPCSTDSDCESSCYESGTIEMKCKTFHRNKDQTLSVGPTQRICVPASAKSNCNTQMGGIEVWNADGAPDKMEWSCVCSYPDWASGVSDDGLCSLNPDICSGGTFNWTIDSGREPLAEDCICPDGTTRMTSLSGGYPICVPDKSPNPLLYCDSFNTPGLKCPYSAA